MTKINCNIFNCLNNKKGSCSLEKINLVHNDPEGVSHYDEEISLNCKEFFIPTEKELEIISLKKKIQELESEIEGLQLARKREITIPESILETDYIEPL